MSANQKVGRGQPPIEHQFKKGQSGNPSGRPKKRPSAAEVLGSLMEERMRVRNGDKIVRMSREEARLRALVTKALQGDASANRRISQVIAEGPNGKLSLTQGPARMPIEQEIAEVAKLLHISYDDMWKIYQDTNEE